MKIMKSHEARPLTPVRLSWSFMCFMVACAAIVPAAAHQQSVGIAPPARASQARVPSNVDPAIELYEPASDFGYVSALQTLMPLVDATFGVEAFSTSARETNTTGRKIPIAGRTVAEILDDLDRAVPGYARREVNGVILIQPRDRGGPSFLDTTVPDFRVQNETIQGSVRTLAHLFDDSVPIRSTGSAITMPCPLNKPETCSAMMTAIADGSHAAASVTLQGATARDILGAVALAHHSHYWLVRHLDDTRAYDNSTITFELGAGTSEMFTARHR
jgi:hypothetical protein